MGVGTPYYLQKQEMADLLKACKTCFSKGDKVQMKYRSRKDKQQSILITLHLNPKAASDWR
jgi:coproporphyrinogen III oxidase-like Fe-S oxidoreductase